MAPVEPEAVQSNLKPLTNFGLHSGAVVLLLIGIVRFLLKVSDDLPPAYRTRRRIAKHRRNITLFAVLFGIALFVGAYHAIAWRVASYRKWANYYDVVAPGSLWQGWYANSKDRWQLGRWMQDVDLAREADQAAIGTSKAFWWTYQHFVAIITWSIFVGIEGRYRNIPQYITIAFVALAELCGLAPAASLFFLSLVITHIPLTPSTESEQTQLLTPGAVLLLVPALSAYIWIYYLPALLEYSIWTSLSTLGYFVVPVSLVVLAQPKYLHNTTEHKTIRSARLSYTAIFRILAWASLSIHVARTITAIFDTAPPREELHHDRVWTMHAPEDHTLIDQALTILSRILGALHDNPIVSLMGWDVLLTELAFCAWAVIRGLDARAMLRNAGLIWSKETSEIISHKAHAATNAVSKPVEAVTKAISKRAAAADEESDDEDESTHRTVEDEFEELIHEAETAPGGGKSLRRTTRGAGRPHHGAPSSPLSSEPASPRARRAPRKQQSAGRSQHHNDEDEDEDRDREYAPTPATEKQVSRMANLAADEEGMLEETEAGALAWGLFAVGGLGTAAAGVLGAEVGGAR